jgi:RNA polymerase sigma factor (sigma-70 family)
MSKLVRVVESAGSRERFPSIPGAELPDVESLVLRWGPRCYGVAKRFLDRDQQLAEVLQAAFCSALETDSELLSSDQLERRIHQRLIEACVRRMQLDFARDQSQIAALLPRFDATGHRITRLSPMAKHASAEQLRQAVRRLPETHRTVYLLSEAEGFGIEAIAALLELSAAQARTCLSLARQAILTLLSPHS